MTAARDMDTLVVGGGVVGLSIGYGLAATGERVRVLDEGDDAFRAARGNFGLVWVQGKGLNSLDYARWSMAAARLWPEFARELAERTGVDVELSQPGGLTMYLTQEDLARRAIDLASLREGLDGEYPYEMLDPAQLRELSPFVGPDVVGASFSPLDGHASPLRLLRALMRGFTLLGGEVAAGNRVDRIERHSGEFRVWAGDVQHVAGRVILAAGLGNRELAPMVGLQAPVRPVRGQLLVSERMQPFVHHPSLYVRQTGEGVVQIGDSKEDVGFDDGTTLEQLAQIAKRAVRCFPILGGVNIVRTWGALRVMSPDGLPIYQASAECPGAYLVTCHSGITLASLHAKRLVTWLRGGLQPPEIRAFGADRFGH